MAVELGDIIGQIGSGVYRLVKGKDVDLTEADLMGSALDDNDLMLIDDGAAGTQASTKKSVVSRIFDYIVTKFSSVTSFNVGNYTFDTDQTLGSGQDGFVLTYTDGVGISLQDAAGLDGADGADGAAATIAVGTVTTGSAGSSATVTNSGTSSAATFNFSIPKGDTGAAGSDGADGSDGAAATIAVGTVTTGAAGSSATVTNSGSSSAATFDFSIPRGAAGADGADGANGADGADGSAATIAVGTVTTGSAGSSATVTNSGTSSAATFNFSIPKGDTGAAGSDGADGADGAAATISVGTVTTGAAGSSATVTNSGSSSAATFDFSIPKGDTGAAGADGSDGADGSAATISVGTVTTGSAGSSATVTNSGSSSAATFDFSIPQGAAGADGSDGADGSAATITVGTVTTGAAGSAATVTNAGSSSAAVFNFSIPQGAAGADGADGADGSDATVTAGDGIDVTGGAVSVDLKANGGLVIESTELAVDLAASSITGTLANTNTTATSANTADKIVARDSNGDFIAGTIDSSIKLNLSGNNAGDHQGIIMYSGSTSLTGQAGKLVALSGGSWVLADKDAVGTSGSCLIGVALGSGSGSPATDGTLLYGMVTLSTDPGSAGEPLYVGDAGAAENDVSGYTSGDTVRLIGYCLNNQKILFQPSTDWIEL